MKISGIAAIALAAATLFSGAASAQDGNAAAGEEVFNSRCGGCHTADQGAPNRQGPNLFGVIGSQAGSRNNGFRYSSALSNSGVTWDTASIGSWLEGPRAFIPGTRMSFNGLASARDRADVAAFLASLN